MSAKDEKQKKSGGYFDFIVKFLAITIPILIIELLGIFETGVISATTMQVLVVTFVALSLVELAAAKKVDKSLEMPEEASTK